jgi:hypothetical protein
MTNLNSVAKKLDRVIDNTAPKPVETLGRMGQTTISFEFTTNVIPAALGCTVTNALRFKPGVDEAWTLTGLTVATNLAGAAKGQFSACIGPRYAIESGSSGGFVQEARALWSWMSSAVTGAAYLICTGGRGFDKFSSTDVVHSFALPLCIITEDNPLYVISYCDAGSPAWITLSYEVVRK